MCVERGPRIRISDTVGIGEYQPGAASDIELFREPGLSKGEIMDSAEEVSVRITVAIISRSRLRAGMTGEERLAETYVNLFSEVLKRVKNVIEVPQA